MYFIDVQGTLISDSDKSPLNGACELITHLNESHTPYCIITNNTKAKSDEFLSFLRGLGLGINDGAYIDPFCVLKSILGPCRAALFGADEFKKTMGALGYKQDLQNPQAVLIASGDNFGFDEFASMIELLQNGAKLIAMHETSVYKKHGRLYPGVGAICAMLEYATSTKAVAVGKPSKAYYQSALELIKAQCKQDISFSDITIISDDAKGDLVGAKAMGMKTALVLSGKVQSLDKAGVDKSLIDAVYADVGEFLKLNLRNK